MSLAIIRRAGLVFLHDSMRSVDVIAMTPFEAEWLSHELRVTLTSEFCVQLHLAASEAQRETLAATHTVKQYPLKRG